MSSREHVVALEMGLMCNLQTIADRFEIDALRADFTDAAMMHDYDRFASLFTHDGIWRSPHANVALVGRGEIRAGIERMQNLWSYFIQTSHPGTIRLEGDAAAGRTYITEFGLLRDGSSHRNFAVCTDRYQRTPDGWKLTERVYEIRYLDSSPLTGSAPDAAELARLGHNQLHV